MLSPEMPLDMGYGVLGYMISEEEQEDGTIVRSENMLAFATFNTEDITERKFVSEAQEGEVPDKNGYLGMIGYEGYPYP